MNDRAKTIVFIGVAVLIGGGAFTYGALTAGQPAGQPVSQKPAPSSSTAPTPKPPTKQQLQDQLTTELPVITGVLTTAYPKAASEYTVADAKLYDNGKWFGATLRYHGPDTLNRDTLRVLMQKKGSTWILRTKPPTILLSAKQYPDVPKSVIIDINKVVGLP